MKEWVIGWVRGTKRLIASNRELLNELDREIGDGDHGENLDRAFSLMTLDGDYASGADVLRQVALGLRVNLPGEGGAILTASYQRMADVLALADDLLADDYPDRVPVEMIGEGLSSVVAALVEGALAGGAERGGAVEGEKTMLDAWGPAARAARKSADAGAPASSVLAAASEAAREGAQATVDMVAQRGRAAFLGEYSRGHMDAGAKTVSLIVQAAAQACADLA